MKHTMCRQLIACIWYDDKYVYRLLTLARENELSLSNTTFLVLDEADRM